MTHESTSMDWYVGSIGSMAQHISVMLEDLYAALDEGRPWSMVRMGDGELQALRGLHAPWAYCENRCATLGDAGDLRQRSIQAVGDADWVGWLQDRWLAGTLESGGLLPSGWTEWYADIVDRLGHYPTLEEIVAKFGEEPDLLARSQFGWANLHMGLRRGFVERVLRNEQLFLVGEPMGRWLEQVLRPAGLGANAVVWSGETTISTMAHAVAIAEAFAESPATVMFASLGVWALPVVGRAKQLGKVALDWGHAPDHNAKITCEAHKDSFEPPYAGRGKCPHLPGTPPLFEDGCQAHWRYKLNTTEEDSPAGTMAWYKKAGAPQCLPEKGYY